MNDTGKATPPKFEQEPRLRVLAYALVAAAVAAAFFAVPVLGWIDGPTAFMGYYAGTMMSIAGLYFGALLLPEGTVGTRIQEALFAALTWGALGVPLYFAGTMLLFVAAALGVLAWLTAAYALPLLLPGTVPDAAVALISITFGLLMLAYASPWVLFVPAAILCKHFDHKGVTIHLLAWLAGRANFRLFAYVAAVALVFITSVTGTLPSVDAPPWHASAAVATQALVIFLAIDQVLATFYPDVLERMAASQRRAVVWHLTPEPEAAPEKA